MFEATPAPKLSASLISLLFLPLLTAQVTTNTASLAGKVRDENGVPVRSIVTATSGAFLQRALSGSDGTFQFSKLPAGTYSLCAQVSPSNVGPKDDPFLDSCAWYDLTAPRVALVSGQARDDAAVTVKRGYLLKIRVNDPAKLLPAIVGNSAGKHLSLLIAGPSALVQLIPISDQDAGGRTHSTVIAYDTAHKLFIHSATFALKDANGRDLDGVTPLDVKVTHGGPPPTLVINVIQAVKP